MPVLSFSKYVFYGEVFLLFSVSSDLYAATASIFSFGSAAARQSEREALIQNIKDSTTMGKTMFQRKNYKEAVPYFRAALRCSTRTGNQKYELSCLNNLVSSLRMTGPAGCPEAEQYADRGLDLAAKMDLDEITSVLNAYINAGSIECLKHNWHAAATIFNAAEDMVQRARASNVQFSAQSDALLAQCNAQAHMGLLKYAVGPDNSLLGAIRSRLTYILSLDVSNEVQCPPKATSTRSGALTSRPARPPADSC